MPGRPRIYTLEEAYRLTRDPTTREYRMGAMTSGGFLEGVGAIFKINECEGISVAQTQWAMDLDTEIRALGITDKNEVKAFVIQRIKAESTPRDGA